MRSNVTERSVKLAAESIDIVHHVSKVFVAASRNWILAAILSLCLKGFKLTLSVLQEQEKYLFPRH